MVQRQLQDETRNNSVSRFDAPDIRCLTVPVILARPPKESSDYTKQNVIHGPLARYVKLRVGHAPEIAGNFPASRHVRAGNACRDL